MATHTLDLMLYGAIAAVLGGCCLFDWRTALTGAGVLAVTAGVLLALLPDK